MYSCYSFLHLDFDPSLHTFFPTPKYAAVEPENKHSLKSQIKLPPELLRDLILHSLKSVEVLTTDHKSK